MNIIVGRNGKETVARIADTIGATVVSKHFLRRTEAWRVNGIKQRRGYLPVVDGITINWAINPAEVSYNGIVYNETGVGLASNKPRARLTMLRAGVPTPNTTTDKREALRWVSEGKTIICRPASHQAGRNFFVISPSSSEIDRNGIMSMSDYYSEFFPKTHEYRCHGGHGKVLVLQEKVPNRDGIDLVRPSAWNHASNDFIFKILQWSEFPKAVCKAGLDAIKALGLDFGAVDIMADSEGNIAVCEVNTSPALEDYCAERYSKYFMWLNESPTKRNHWDYSGYTKGKSYAWKNCQLNGSIEQDE